MTYIQYRPAPPLNTYINAIYYRDTPMPYAHERVLPMPFLNLMINLGGPFQAYTANRADPFAICTDSWWVGLWSGYHIIQWPANLQYFMVDFKPGGAYPFLRVPLAELHDEVVALDTIWGNFAAEIRERLYAAPTIEMRFPLLEQFLLARLNEAPHGLNTIQYAIAQMAQTQGALSIRALSDDIGMSQKHLIAQFKRLVGGTPKELARLYRFQNVMARVAGKQSVDWTRVAHDSLYYDQSHFNKDFEVFTGYTPTDYLHLRRRIAIENPAHAAYLRILPTVQNF